MRRIRLLASLLAFSGALIAVPAFASNPVYSGSGYDVSYPQCKAVTGLPHDGSFAIVGVGNGRPFTTNPCLENEWSWASSYTSSQPPSLYINTGYSGAYGRQIARSGYCTGASPEGLTGKYYQAWQIGCSEAEYSVSAAAGRVPAVWWLDVETTNSWSSSNFKLNADTIQGALDRFNSAGETAGVYSSASMWNHIVRGNAVNGIAGGWNANYSCASFLPVSTWLEQRVISNLDNDSAC